MRKLLGTATMPMMRHIRVPVSSPAVTAGFTTTSRDSSAFPPQPAPPRLAKEEQEIFDKLVRDSQSAGAFATPRAPKDSEKAPIEAKEQRELTVEDLKARIAARGDGEELHPNVRRGAPPEFKGDVNPKTGEVGGPKNDPLRPAHGGDWSYNGRVTDF